MKLAFLLPALLATQIHAETTIHHSLKAQLTPSAHSIDVQDTITLPDVLQAPLGFSLHDGLNPTSPTNGVTILAVSSSQDEGIAITRYELKLAQGIQTFTINYAGEIYHPLPTSGFEYDRGINETPGLIGDEGIYLTNSSAWYPRFFQTAPLQGLITFSADVTLPMGWDTVSQGQRTQHDQSPGRSHVRWEENSPQDEFYLVGGPVTTYERKNSVVQLLAYLRTPDPDIATKYLDAADQYIRMYSDLLGAYPYRKFAVVENFWETGYGMPSFTLLGPTILRFPFIINSSFPHEILHNWWGNGVFVDASTGNWCEGLTAYLADHLMQEQVGQGAEYRRSTLQKYTDFVNAKNDFPLNKFSQRSDAATEAIGYGKASMLFHMLRQKFGDDIFVQVLRKFYVDRKFHRASYDNIQDAFELVTQTDLSSLFSQWVTTTGAPEIHIVKASVSTEQDGKFELAFTLEQIQSGPLFRLEVPVAVSHEGQALAYQSKVTMTKKRQTFHLELIGRPYQLDVDPEFDVFRRLDRFEIPPSISQALGSTQMLFVIPSAEPQANRDAYIELAKSISGEATSEIRLDSEVTELPIDRSVWLFGAGNLLKSALTTALKDLDISLTSNSIGLAGVQYALVNHSFALTMRNPKSPQQSVGWIIADPLTSIPGIGRKIPHYGKYSYLVFEGLESTNIAKGVWNLINTPMSVPVVQPDGTTVTGPKTKLAPRNALK